MNLAIYLKEVLIQWYFQLRRGLPAHAGFEITTASELPKDFKSYLLLTG